MNLLPVVLIPVSIVLAVALAGCDDQSTDATTGKASAVTPPAEPAPAPKPDPAPEPAPAPEPEPVPEPEPESAPELEIALPGSPALEDMAPRGNGLFIGEIEVGEGDVLDADDKAATIMMIAWNVHGDHVHEVMRSRAPMVMPLDDALMFTGWTKSLEGMKVGGSRKVLADAGTQVSEQLGSGNPVVLDITLQGIDEYITLPETLPGVSIGDAQLQSSDTGLGWYDVIVGEGPSPSPTDSVRVHYSGWLVNDLKFDSSVDRGVPFTVNMQGGVIDGWLEGLKTMRVGGTRKLIIPAELAYGWKPSSGPIPAGATLIFDVEMIEIVGPDVPAGDGGK